MVACWPVPAAIARSSCGMSPAAPGRDTLSQSLKEVYTVAFSPDGRQLVAGGVDNRIRLWTISRRRQGEHQSAGDVAVCPRRTDLAAGLLSRRADAGFGGGGQTCQNLGRRDSDAARHVGSSAGLADRRGHNARRGVTLCGPSRRLVCRLSVGGSGRRFVASRRWPRLEPVDSHGEQPPVDQLPQTAEVEPNDQPDKATPLALPTVATGIIKSTGSRGRRGPVSL